MNEKEYLKKKAYGKEISEILQLLQGMGYHFTGFDLGYMTRMLEDSKRAIA